MVKVLACVGAVAALTCQNGAYRTRSADLVVVSGIAGAQRYTLPDGRTGVLRPEKEGVALVPGWNRDAQAAGRASCGSTRIELSLPDGPSGTWDRIPLAVTETEFRRDGVRLRGRLLAPPGERWPVVVLVHGSEAAPAIEVYHWQYLLPAQGVAVFVFDKRGTGGSGGSYTQDFHVLAGDVAAAVGEARRLAGTRATGVGLVGGSQGGWVAPLAASQVPVDFVIVAFGLLVPATVEDRAQVLAELRREGFDEAVLRRAGEVADATARLVRSRFRDGYEELAELRTRYGSEPWFARMRGEYTGDILKSTEEDLRRHGKERHDPHDVPWDYDPLPTVRGLRTPQLWILAAEDREAPLEETLSRLHGLQSEGAPIDLAIFPRTDHGIVEFDEAPDGTRTRRRYARGFLDLPADWIHGRAVGRVYGDASLRLRASP